MPLNLEIIRGWTPGCEGITCVERHPTEPWLLCALYKGDVEIWDCECHAQIKLFKTSDKPTRAAKFVPRKNWVVAGSDDYQIRVFNYNTLECVRAFDAHSNYVRCIVVHPTKPYIISCSDDPVIKLWNWEREWTCQQTFSRHIDRVMQVVINPKDHSTFASASPDTYVYVWRMDSPEPNFMLETAKVVTCVDYHRGDGPYLITCGEDSIKIWDYQSRTCIQHLEAPAKNVTAVCCHPKLPILVTGYADGTFAFWHDVTYVPDAFIKSSYGRVRAICADRSNGVVVGFDDGMVVVKIGRGKPAISMDMKGGKIIWENHLQMHQANLKGLSNGKDLRDGEIVPIDAKFLGASEIIPMTLKHNSNGRFVALCGERQYIIFTAVALRTKASGDALGFAWGRDGSDYAILKSTNMVQIFIDFEETMALKPVNEVSAIFGGHLLGVATSDTKELLFYDWLKLHLIRRIQVWPCGVYWSDNGDLVCLAANKQFFIIRYDKAAVEREQSDNNNARDGIENAFAAVGDVFETANSGIWVGDCFVYINSVNKLQYSAGCYTVTVAYLDRTMYILGYIAEESRLYLYDIELNITSYLLPLHVLEYLTAVLRGDKDTANRLLPILPHGHRTSIAQVLEKLELKEQAQIVSTDLAHRFELALSMGDMQRARGLAEEAAAGADETLWARLGDAALFIGDVGLAETCYLKTGDFSALLLLAHSTGNRTLLRKVATEAASANVNNVAFAAYFTLNQPHDCVDFLLSKKNFAEAAFFARSYVPSRAGEVMRQWRASLGDTRAARALADPDKHENLFPEMRESLDLERFQKEFGREFAALDPGLSNADRSLEEERRRHRSQTAEVHAPPLTVSIDVVLSM